MSATGVATSVAPGTTTITATSGNVVSNGAVLTVNNQLVSIAITPTNANINIGQTQQYTAIGTYAAGNTADITNTATWASSNPLVATIDANGLATGLTVGSTTITATLDGVTSNGALLTVNNPLVAIVVTPPTATITTRQSQQFTATGTFFNGSTQDITNSVTWNSSNTAAATINATGLASGVDVGTSNITATSGAITSNPAVLTVNSFAYVVNNDTNISICSLAVNGAIIGCLTNSAVPNPKEITINPTGTFAYITQTSTGNGIYVCNISATTGNLTGCVQTATSSTYVDPAQIAITPNGVFAYIADANGVTNCVISAVNGTLIGCALTGNIPLTSATGVAPLPSGSTLFIARNNQVFSCAIALNGVLSSCVATSAAASNQIEIAVNPNGNFAYLVSAATSTVGICPVNGTGLDACTNSLAFSDPRGVALNKTGTFIYVTQFLSNTVQTCSIDPGGGSFTCPGVTTGGFASPFGIYVS